MTKGARKSFIFGRLVLAGIFAAGAWAQSGSPPCEPSAEVKAALQGLPTARAERIAALRSLLSRFPNDPFVHRSYQNAARYPAEKDRDAVIAEYRDLAGQHPNDPRYTYLALRARIGVGTKELLPELEKVAAGYPLARLSLVEIYQASGFKDLKEAREHLEAYVTACPASLEAYNYFRSLETSDFVRESAARLRKLLETSTDPDALSNYGTLWSLEFRVLPGNEHEALRKQVAEDIKRLRTIDPGKSRAFLRALQEGYKLINDTEGTKWVTEETKNRFPQGAFYAVYEEWRAKNPYPKSEDPPGKTTAYNQALLKASEEWVRQWPDQMYAWYQRGSALRVAEKPDPAAIEAAGEGVLKILAKGDPDFSFMSSIGGASLHLQIAHLYATKGVWPDRLPELVEKGIQELDKPRDRGWQSDLYSRPPGSDDDNRMFVQWHGWTTIADIWLAVKDKDKAREAIQRLQTLADKDKPKADSKESDQAAKQRTYLSRQVTYWQKMGELAALADRKIDALTFYQNALLARPRRADSPADQKDELAEKARALWKEFGGSNEGWQAWFERARDLFGQLPSDAGGMSWTKMGKPLPTFELADMKGAKWRLADLKGKTTLIGLWATW